MAKFTSRLTQILIDIGCLSVAYWVAYLIRFEGSLPLVMVKLALVTWPYVVAAEYFVLTLLEVPQFPWRYVSLREVSSIGIATLISTALLVLCRVVGAAYAPHWEYAQYAAIPFGVIAGNCVLSLSVIGGVRAIWRLVCERSSAAQRRLTGTAQKATILVGAGRAGVLVAKEIAGRPDLGIKPVAFLDDDLAKRGAIIHGIRVMGRVADLAEVAIRCSAKQVLITIADAPGESIRKIVDECEKAELPVKIVPGLYELLDDHVSLSRIREVSIEDLLGRKAVQLNADQVAQFLVGRTVLISGAGGSIGSELCRQVARFGARRIVLAERCEYALFTIQQELSSSFPDVECVARICDVSDRARVERVFQEFRPEVVFHAAAHKHVPMMEDNAGEAIKNNVFGTKTFADAAAAANVEAFVLISTDKAVNPTSIMGATKRAAEMYVQSLSQRASTRFVAVRFGNVLGSAGSVIPTFKAQIAAGGPVTVTHPEMKRYFMTIPEATQLVIQAAAMGTRGEIFVLDMGQPVRIVDLARELIRLSGFKPDVDIRIQFTGMRPGEKLFEELGFDEERMSRTKHPKVFVGKLTPVPLEQIEVGLVALRSVIDDTEPTRVRHALQQLIPEMQLSSPELLPAQTGPSSGTLANGEWDARRVCAQA